MADNRKVRVVARELAQPTRLDRVIRNNFPKWGRRAVQALVNAGRVKVNGRQVWLCSWKVKNGDRLDIVNPPQEKVPPPTRFDKSWIISHESELIAVNKPAGLLSHSTRWTQTGNLLDLAIKRFGPLSLFHRLDRDTSGVVLLTGNGPINRYLDQAFKSRMIKKEYIALVPAKNNLSSSGIIKARIGPHGKRRDMMAVVARGGKHAITRYEIIAESDGKQLLRLWPETGRTHQLRVHLLHKGAPILGDRLYGTPPRRAKRLMLHARQITLPALEEFPQRVYTAPVPEEFGGMLPLSDLL